PSTSCSYSAPPGPTSPPATSRAEQALIAWTYARRTAALANFGLRPTSQRQYPARRLTRLRAASLRRLGHVRSGAARAAEAGAVGGGGGPWALGGWAGRGRCQRGAQGGEVGAAQGGAGGGLPGRGLVAARAGDPTSGPPGGRGVPGDAHRGRAAGQRGIHGVLEHLRL